MARRLPIRVSTRLLPWLGAALGFAATPAPAAPPAFVDPPSLTSSEGELEVTLEAAPSTVTVARKTVTANVFNGEYTVPVLRLSQGDTLRVQQINHMPEWDMNFHSHGVTTTPLLNGDNVFVVVDPNSTFETEIPIPMGHPSGMFWFHPHVHGFVNNTLSNGMAGALIIGDILEPFPELAGITEHVMMLKDLKVRKRQVVEDPDPSGKTTRTINGQYKPVITIAPGELQFWRVGNFSANIFYNLELPGVTFNVIAIDGNLQNQLHSTDELLIPPGGRVEMLVRGPAKRGKYKLKAKKFKTGPSGDKYPKQLMATLRVTGDPVTPQVPLPTKFPTVPDLREQKVDMTREVVFDDTDDPNVFVIDGQVYDEDRIDQPVQLGDLEEWTIQNASTEFHVFHIHQGDFQVVSINGVEQEFRGYQDVVNLPVAEGSVPGEVVMRIKFDPPIIVGKYVYHCHIVQHEDQGMMGNVLVEDELATLMQSQEPPDLIADALTPASGSYWCR